MPNGGYIKSIENSIWIQHPILSSGYYPHTPFYRAQAKQGNALFPCFDKYYEALCTHSFEARHQTDAFASQEPALLLQKISFVYVLSAWFDGVCMEIPHTHGKRELFHAQNRKK